MLPDIEILFIMEGLKKTHRQGIETQVIINWKTACPTIIDQAKGTYIGCLTSWVLGYKAQLETYLTMLKLDKLSFYKIWAHK